MFNVRRALIVRLVISTLVALLVLTPDGARAERFSADTTDVSSLDVLDALADLQEILGGYNNPALPCPYSFQVTGAALTWEARCRGVVEGSTLAFHDFPIVETHPFAGHFNFVSRENVRRGFNGIGLSGTQMTRAARAWIALARERQVLDPSADPSFQALLGAGSVDTEQLRRVQVQVEAALRANRNIDAARLYRDALRTSPVWAEGHFNLGLLYGDLELFPEAIIEMRRYLYLSPNGADARAVQDRIYEWEAAMASH